MWELDCEEGWALKIWCFWIVVLEKTLESPLDCQEIQLVNSEGDQPWDFFGRNDAKAETPVLWPPHVKSWLSGRLWYWEGLGAAGEEDDRGWDGWMASWTKWTWVCVNSGGWWWTGRPGMLRFMRLQRVGHDWTTELNWWEVDGETMEAVRPYFGGSKITADSDCSHEINRHLLLGRKVRTNLDSIFKTETYLCQQRSV